jgi:uncharacterized protein
MNFTTILNNLEEKYNITIIYACEAGSRNWGLDYDGSDHDIRYVYIHNSIFWYISVNTKKDTIDDTIIDP